MNKANIKHQLSHDKIQAEIANLMAETANLNRETKFLPWKVFIGSLATFIALGYVVLKFSTLIAPIVGA